MAENIIIGLDKHAPCFVMGEDDTGKPIFTDQRIAMEALWKATRVLGKDPQFKNNPFVKGLLLILDGSGTQVYEPTAHHEHTRVYCYWKKKCQVRWYIVTDAYGKILFVSAVYEGKKGDTVALDETHSYE